MCHEMYTSVSHIAQLLGAIPGQSGATGDSPVSRGRELQAVLYSCMARALCAGSAALMDMVLQLEGSGMELRKEASAVGLCALLVCSTQANGLMVGHFILVAIMYM